MRRWPARVVLPTGEALAVLEACAARLAAPPESADFGEQGQHVTFVLGGARVAVAQALIERVVPRLGAVHPLAGAPLGTAGLAWLGLRPAVVIDAERACGLTRSTAALKSVPALLLRSGEALAVTGPVELVEGDLEETVEQGAWAEGSVRLCGRLADGAFVIDGEWLETFVQSARGEG